MNNSDNKLKDIIAEEVKNQLANNLFTARKLTDTPTDGYMVANRKYVNLGGTTRPVSSVFGQHFLDMNLASGRGIVITWNGIGWINGLGAYV